MEVLKTIPILFIMFAIGGITAGAASLSISKFGDATDKCFNGSYTYQETTKVCNSTTGGMLNSGQENMNFSDTYFAVFKTLKGTSEMAAQLPTVAIISIMVIIISVLVGAFAVTRMFG